MTVPQARSYLGCAMKKKYYVTALALVGSAISLTPLRAGVLFTFEEVGDDVVATTSGSVGTGWSSPVSATSVGAGNSFLTARSISGRSTAGGGRYYGGPGLFTLNNELSGVSGSIQSGSATGDFFGYNGDNNLFAPAGVNEGEAFSPDTTITWANETFASLGLDTSLTETPLVLFTLNNNETISAVLSTGGRRSLRHSRAVLPAGARGVDDRVDLSAPPPPTFLRTRKEPQSGGAASFSPITSPARKRAAQGFFRSG